MNRRHLPVLAGVLAASLGFISNAGAFTDMTHPGVSCHPDPGTSGSPFFYLGTIGNGSTTQTLNVHCPLNRESTSINNVVLAAFDRSSGANVACTVVYENYSGTNYYASSVSGNTTGSGLAVQGISLGGLISPNPGGVGGGSLYATCSIPPTDPGQPNSHIAGFTVVQ